MSKKSSTVEYVWGTGRRKTAVARVRLNPGKGSITVNRKPHDEYFKTDQDRQRVISPFQVTETANKFDVLVNVDGGGPTGQSGAVALGLARALKAYNEIYEPQLRDAGLLTRDSRMKERKKYGQRGARRRFQFSKR